ncbi:MAG: pyrophosphate--fructose-6-phosphate 1-phosphotransferase [Puniceicoccales bacterium]|jgi:pyrophosphate--fructose-6-phosphate 1-phosphotransferase|nr:pyrophosphate--fructose-6-phosphate 1-phosphotransferase [Puniceicoccales bacterium]
MGIKRIGILTAGGLAPCLSASIACLIGEYSREATTVEIIFYRHGYAGVLLGDSFPIDEEIRAHAARLLRFGGSVIGNSRVKLTNGEDCEKRGLVRRGENPQVVAAERLRSDKIDVLHTIGGDDTNIVAASLSAYLKKNNYSMAVIGLPKTVDNDISPIVQTLGADTAADMGSLFFRNVVNECTTSHRMLIIHEVMGRHCGWLTYATARAYRQWLDQQEFLPSVGLERRRWDIHGMYIPEISINFQEEIARLRHVMDEVGNVNLFISEGAGMDVILLEMKKKGEKVPTDAFGHVKLDLINAGQWFGEQLAKEIGAHKVLVQKSGYFARSSAPNAFDLNLIQKTAKSAVRHALRMESGVVGMDEERDGEMALIDFARFRGGKQFDGQGSDCRELLREICGP